MIGEERSMTAVLKDIVGNVQQIIGAEFRLARAEMGQEAGKARRGAMWLAVGGGIAVLAPAFALLAAVYRLSTSVAPWMAALIVAAAAGIVGGALIAVGLKQMQQVHVAPTRTMATIEENIQWAKRSTR